MQGYCCQESAEEDRGYQIFTTIYTAVNVREYSRIWTSSSVCGCEQRIRPVLADGCVTQMFYVST